MNLFKFLPFLIIFISIVTLNFIYKNYINQNRIDPISTKNNFLSQLNQAFSNSKIQPNQINLRSHQDQIDFNINDLKVIFSTQKDPHWQVASLQEILNTAKIKDKHFKFIDLSIAHPYATLQNN